MWTRKRRSAILPICCTLAVILYRAWQLPLDLYAYYDIIRAAKPGTCTLPRLNPYDPSIAKYLKQPKPLTCKKLQLNLAFIDTDGHLTVNFTEAKLNGYEKVSCRYRCFYHNSGVSDDQVLYDTWEELPLKVKLKCEFVEVDCSAGLLGISIYHHYLSQIVPQPALPASKKLSVVVIGIDSMSLSNMIRQLPLSVDFLQNKMHATIFKGHSKIGDNTWTNMLAMLTGLLAESGSMEFKPDLPLGYDRFFDDFAPYIWKDYASQGYRTFFSEDRADIMTFNYPPKKGFLHPPTDHYFRPYWLAVHWNPLHLRSSAYCYNSMPEHQIHLNWLEEFILKYFTKGQSIFGFLWWQNLSHDTLNAIGVADADFVKFLERIHPTMNSTILIVLADHGHRYDSIRESVIGRLEARMPFLAIALPPWLRAAYPDLSANFHLNSNLLTTQHDVYATLVDILRSDFKDFNSQKPAGHGLSLFRPIPANRSCLTAHIPEEYCPCYQESTLSVDDPRVVKVAEILVQYVNQLVNPYASMCAKLELITIRHAHVFLPSEKMLNDPQVSGIEPKSPTSGLHISYRVQVEVKPSHALLEAVIKHILDSNSYRIDGDVDRVNAYGKTSDCVKHEPVIKKYCFCSKL